MDDGAALADDMAAFGPRLCAHRQSAGLSQEELADRAGLSSRAIANLERGRTRWPHPGSVRRLADALGLRGRIREEFFAAAGRRLAHDMIGCATVPGGRPARAPGDPVAPQQMPGPVLRFVGRERELAALTGLLDQVGTTPAVVISAIGGTAGVGKTALAVYWAHQVAEEFPDGQLYVNLHGYDAEQPMSASDALAGFLRALGVPGPEIPGGADERAAAYRSLLAGRRMFVLLDNACRVEQVRPLLPGSSGCVTVVTSRDALPGLVARDGALRLEVGLLPLPDAVSLLRGLIGTRVDDDPGAALMLASRCCRLPLALRIAAELAVASPDIPLPGLAAELADLQHRLDVLETGGDDQTAVRAVFSWSCRHLDPGAARTFRLAGLHPGPDLDGYATAALTGTTLPVAQQRLGQLARAHLVQATQAGRYGLHDLLRGYARELATAQDGEPERRAALTSLLDYYLRTAAIAMDAAFPAERHRRPCVPPPATPAPAFTGVAAALAWLNAELPSLVAVAGYAAGNGWPEHATCLSATLFRYLDSAGHFPEAVAIHGHANRAARRAGARMAEADALIGLGLVDGHQGRHQQATSHFAHALAGYRHAGDQAGQARALNYLGLVHSYQGRYKQATGNFEQAVALFRAVGERTGEAHALGNLGAVDLRQGRYEQAVGYQQQALGLFRETGDRDGEASTLGRLGLAGLRQGRYQQAASHFQQALSRYREIGDRMGEASAQAKLGLVGLHQGRHQQAASHFRQALTSYRELGDPSGQATALNGLGEVLLATGCAADARAQHAAALDIATQAGEKYEQARAHAGLAGTSKASGHPRKARHHWQQALTLYTLLGAPEADQVHAQLAAASQGQCEPLATPHAAVRVRQPAI